MAIYLGENGGIELKRDSLNIPIDATVDPDDVNVEKRRFSFDFAAGALISGDQLIIAARDGSTLTFIPGVPDDDREWEGFAHVDPVGGIRLYRNYIDAINGDLDKALQLIKNTAPELVTVKTTGTVFRCLAQVQSFELTDARETIDITSLGEEFRRNYANGLISGQGSMTCFWDYEYTKCIDDYARGVEFPHYLSQLVIRLRQGADFIGRFYIYADGTTSVWQESTCIVTSVALTVTPDQLVRTTIQFVTTGEIRLLTGTPPEFLLQENDFRVLKEDDEALLLENSD